MKLPGPLPRFRLYTSLKSYFSVLADLALMRSTRGNDVEELEADVRRLFEVPYALALPQNRVGTFLSLRALIQPGQKVVLSPFTIHEVVNMVICAGGVPVFADTERHTCNLDPKLAEELLDENTGAVLATHMHGLAMDVERLAEVCRERGIALVEDAAQSLGSRLRGRPVGTFGDAGAFSFGMYKNLSTFLGGMLITNRGDLHAKLAEQMRAFPFQELGPHLAKVKDSITTDIATFPPLFRALVFRVFRYGYLHDVEALNKRVRVEDAPLMRRVVPPDYLRRMRPMQARLGRTGLPLIEAHMQTRIGFARIYHEGLQDLEQLTLPPFHDDGTHGYAYYPIQYRDRDALVRHLLRAGCDLAVQHIKNCADLPCFAEFQRDCPNARANGTDTILMPTYPRYSQSDVERNVAAIRGFFEGGQGR